MNLFNMKRLATWLIALSAILIGSPAMASHPYAEWADEFGIDLNASYDGTRVMEMKDGSFEFVEHKAPGKMYTRVDIGGMSSGIILREDLGKGYMMMPSMGMYRETSLEDGMMQSSNGLQFQQIEEVGSDEILGYPSTKYKTRFQDKDGKGAGHVWVTDGGVPIKMDMIYSSADAKGLRLTMEFIELNMREQDPAIFELDPNLKPMGMSGLGSIFQQGEQQPGGGSNDATSALQQAMQNMSPEQQEALSGAGLGSLIPGMGGQPEAQAAPAGSAATAVRSESMSKQLTTDNLTQSVQYHLQYLGIDPGNTDGEMSLDTQIAISEFQASRGMKVTGEASPQLLGVLSADVDSQ